VPINHDKSTAPTQLQVRHGTGTWPETNTSLLLLQAGKIFIDGGEHIGQDPAHGGFLEMLDQGGIPGHAGSDKKGTAVEDADIGPGGGVQPHSAGLGPHRLVVVGAYHHHSDAGIDLGYGVLDL